MVNRSVSVILPTYNRAFLLRRALASVLPQLEKGDEVIVVDDGSTDDTERVIKSKTGPIKYIRTENHGAGAARNRGIAEACGYYVAFVDSDDQWLPGKLLLQRSFMDINGDILFCFTDFRVQTRSGRIIPFAARTWHHDNRSWSKILGDDRTTSGTGEMPSGTKDYRFFKGDLYLSQLMANYINVNTMLVRREQAGDALHFAEDTETFEDWECHARLAGRGKCAYIEVETIVQHGHFGKRLTDANEMVCAQSRLKIVERVWGQDREFRKRYEHEYTKIRDDQLGTVAENLILSGKSKKASSYVDNMTNPPLSLRVLTRLPEGLVNSSVNMGRKLKRTLHSLLASV